MKTDYTSGPWTVDPSKARAIGGERIFKVIADRPFGGLIADVSAWWVDTTSAEANARLIAAAPDLLAAIEELCADKYLADPINADRMTNARAAIAKAKGDT